MVVFVHVHREKTNFFFYFKITKLLFLITAMSWGSHIKGHPSLHSESNEEEGADIKVVKWYIISWSSRFLKNAISFWTSILFSAAWRSHFALHSRNIFVLFPFSLLSRVVYDLFCTYFTQYLMMEKKLSPRVVRSRCFFDLHEKQRCFIGFLHDVWLQMRNLGWSAVWQGRKKKKENLNVVYKKKKKKKNGYYCVRSRQEECWRSGISAVLI